DALWAFGSGSRLDRRTPPRRTALGRAGAMLGEDLLLRRGQDALTFVDHPLAELRELLLEGRDLGHVLALDLVDLFALAVGGTDLAEVHRHAPGRVVGPSARLGC